MKKLFIIIIGTFLLIILLLIGYIKYSEYRLNQIITIEKDQEIKIDSIRKDIQPEAQQILDSLKSLP
jgi:TM2 domain-containing membrane protein YozV